MAPPSYSDLGKSSRDVLNKGYLTGVFKLDCKTTTESGVKFSYGGLMSNDNSKVSGNLEMKHTLKDLGITVTEKWNTDNTLNATVDLQDKLLQGLKITLDSSFCPVNSQKKSKLKAALKQERFNLTGDMNLLPTVSPLLNASIVMGHQNWLGGAQMTVDASNTKLTKNAFALNYSAKDFTLHTNVKDGNVFGASIYQKVNPLTEAGVDVVYTASSNLSNIELGLKHKLDPGSSVCAKVNNSGIVGLGFSHKLKEGIILNLSTQLNGKNLNEGGNKLSLGLELEA